jgi:phenylpyruvate tautomerase PptA (4-oxalocrotonate tautomerase family)
MPYIECHIAAGRTKARKTQLIRDIVKVTHEPIGSQDYQCSAVRAYAR